MIRKIGAVSPQTANSKQYVFTSWSDGKAAAHEVTTQSVEKTYGHLCRTSGSGSCAPLRPPAPTDEHVEQGAAAGPEAGDEEDLHVRPVIRVGHGAPAFGP
jgi:hypothetical protein